jgi:hypothetical protein
MTYGYSFGGSVTNSPFTSFAPSSVYHDGNTVPTARLAGNGNRPIFMGSPSAVSASGAGGISCSIEGVTGDLGSGYASTSGGAFRFRISYTSGTLTFGRNSGGGGVVVDAGDSSTWAGSIPGSLQWAQAPDVPGSPAVTPGGTAGTATLTWATPDDGGSAITGYRIFYGTSATLAGATVLDVGVITSQLLTGLTPGLTYYFAVAARNAVTAAATTESVKSAIVNALLGTVPGAPTAATLVTASGLASLSWVAPASDGGVAITGYTIDYGTDNTFATFATKTVGNTARAFTVDRLTPGQTYYFRVKAVNPIGSSAASSTASGAIPARTALDSIKGAGVNVKGLHVAIRSDGANTQALTLGYTLFGTGTTFTTIASLSVGTGATDFAASGGDRNVVLVADTLGNLYAIGTAGDNSDRVLVKRFAYTAPSTWVAAGVLSQALATTGDPLEQFAAIFVAGSTDTVLVLARRAGTVGTGALSYATLNLANIAASSGSLFMDYGSDPTWLSTPPVGAAFNSGVLDSSLVTTGRVAIIANGFAVVDVSAAGLVTGVSKAAAGTATAGSWARVIAVSSTAFAVLTISSGALAWTFYGTNGTVLGSGSYPATNFQGGAAGVQWDAYYNRASGLIVVYYVAAAAGARQLERITVSPSTYAASAATVVTAALGAASSTNSTLRVVDGVVDERRVIVEAANLLTGVKSVAVYSDAAGNVVPNAPVLTPELGYDAANARVFAWAFGDPNSLDIQTSYELQIQRVSDLVNVVDTGKITTATMSRSVAANTLANGINYQWRVRTYDELDTVGAWSAYQAFTTSALGTLTVTYPTPDNVAGIDTSSVTVTWSYVQANSYTQTQRRVRVIRVSDSVVLSDTTMQASTVGSYTVTGLPSDVPVKVEVSIVTNAPGTPTVLVNRLVTVSYAAPMTPTFVAAPSGAAIVITVANPTPTGSRPATVTNGIYKRVSGSGAAFVRVAIIGPNATYTDHAVRSGETYDYQVVAST